ncbi:MAG TPA: hypothetical protein VFV38_07870 [Ktedonobacteraceae bacterium]|nr:hypothetical protein [Ktedonobacteraceae bacterium]
MKWTGSSQSAIAAEERHTRENPYCGELTYWCHTDVNYHHEVTHPKATRPEIALASAYFRKALSPHERTPPGMSERWTMRICTANLSLPRFRRVSRGLS